MLEKLAQAYCLERGDEWCSVLKKKEGNQAVEKSSKNQNQKPLLTADYNHKLFLAVVLKRQEDPAVWPVTRK